MKERMSAVAQAIDPGMIGESAAPTIFGERLEIVRERVIPWMRQHNPDNAWAPIDRVARDCNVTAVRLGAIANAFPRYLSTVHQGGRVSLRLHRDIA